MYEHLIYVAFMKEVGDVIDLDASLDAFFKKMTNTYHPTSSSMLTKGWYFSFFLVAGNRGVMILKKHELMNFWLVF